MSHRWTVWFVALLFFLAALVGAYKYFYPTYSYRYRLTVNIEADGTKHSGSSVIEVSWYAHFLPELISYSPEIQGEATVIDLGDHGVVVATLRTGESYGRASDGAWGAIWIAARAFGLDSTVEHLPRLPSLQGDRALSNDNLPRLLWFPNPRTPETGRKISEQDFPSVVGDSVRFAGASIGITNDPIVIDIRDKLPWIKSMEEMPPGANAIHLQDNFPISPSLFVGGKS